MQYLLENIEQQIQNPWKILKSDHTSKVVVVKIDSQLLVVKSFNTKSKIHFCRRLFQQSRASINWYYANKLLENNILTFEPIAMIEERYGLFKGKSYFICSYIQGIEALHYFAHGAKPIPEWETVAKNIGLMLQRLAQAGFHHRDLNLSNIILIGNQPWLIDLDSMRQYRSSWKKKHIARRARNRFMENWDETPEVSPKIIQIFQAIFND